MYNMNWVTNSFMQVRHVSIQGTLQGGEGEFVATTHVMQWCRLANFYLRATFSTLTPPLSPLPPSLPPPPPPPPCSAASTKFLWRLPRLPWPGVANHMPPIPGADSRSAGFQAPPPAPHCPPSCAWVEDTQLHTLHRLVTKPLSQQWMLPTGLCCRVHFMVNGPSNTREEEIWRAASVIADKWSTNTSNGVLGTVLAPLGLLTKGCLLTARLWLAVVAIK